MAYDLTLTSPVYNPSGTSYNQTLSGGVGSTVSTILPTNGTFTVQARFKTTVSSGVQVIIGQYGAFWIGTNGTNLQANIGGNFLNLTTTSVVNDGAYHHVALVLDSVTGATLWLDGIKVSSNTSTMAGAAAVYTAALQVRQFYNTATYNWVGEVDEIAISSTALYKASFTPAPVGNSDAALLAVYHFENNGLNYAVSTASPATAPGQPGKPTAQAGNNSVVVTVGQINDGGAAVTGYTFYRNGSATALATNVASPYTDTTALNGTAYTYTTTATNSAGTSVASVASDAVTPAPNTAPGQPGKPTAVAGNNAITITAVAPASNGGATITGYTFYRSGVTAAVATNVASPYTDTGLVNGTAYTYTVAAVNSVGTSISSVASDPATPFALVVVAANDSSLVYSGSWLVTSTSAKTINSGQYVRVLVPAGTITLRFDLTNIPAPVPQVNVSLNGVRVLRAEITASLSVPVEKIYNQQAYNLLEISVAATSQAQSRWSPQSSAVLFLGLTIGSNTAIRKPTAKPKKVMVIGDSITEGAITLSTTTANNGDTDRSDGVLSYAFALGALLGAEIDQIGFAGQQLIQVVASSLPIVGQTYNFLWSGQARSFALPPDLIIINQGTNNSTNDITSAYTTLLNGLLASTPVNTKILALRPYNYPALGSYIQAAIAACTTPPRVTYGDTTGFFTTTDSFDGIHPWGYANLSFIAPAIAALAQPLLYPTANSILSTAQQIRDAMSLAPSVNVTAVTNSLDLVLRQVQTTLNA